VSPSYGDPDQPKIGLFSAHLSATVVDISAVSIEDDLRACLLCRGGQSDNQYAEPSPIA
jgi:hypothetical protein